jgi:hypothetical protein
LLIALPEQIRELVPVIQELQLTSALKQRYPKKEIIGLGSFFVLFCTIGTQVSLILPSSSSLRVSGVQRVAFREACQSTLPMDSSEWRVIFDATKAPL